jgi:hypothetical protein
MIFANNLRLDRIRKLVIRRAWIRESPVANARHL